MVHRRVGDGGWSIVGSATASASTRRWGRDGDGVGPRPRTTSHRSDHAFGRGPLTVCRWSPRRTVSGRGSTNRQGPLVPFSPPYRCVSIGAPRSVLPLVHAVPLQARTVAVHCRVGDGASSAGGARPRTTSHSDHAFGRGPLTVCRSPRTVSGRGSTNRQGTRSF